MKMLRLSVCNAVLALLYLRPIFGENIYLLTQNPRIDISQQEGNVL